MTYEHGGAVLTVAVNLNGKVRGNHTAFILSFEFSFLQQIMAFVIQTSLEVSNYGRKTKSRDSGHSDKMTASCKCRILLCFAHVNEVRKVK